MIAEEPMISLRLGPLLEMKEVIRWEARSAAHLPKPSSKAEK